MNPPPGTVLWILSVTFHCKAVICSLINIFDWAEVKKKKGGGWRSGSYP